MRNRKQISLGILCAGFLTWPLLAGAQSQSQTPDPGLSAKQQPQDPCAQAQDQKSQTSQNAPATNAPQNPQPANTNGQASGCPQTNPQQQQSGQPGSDPPVDQQKTVHPKNSKEDVDTIGNRNVGKGVNFYSLEREIALGKQLAQEVERTSKMIDDPVVTEYVNRVGQNLVRNSDAQVPFTIKVIDSDEVNAFALPGGFFYVNSGLILRAQEESELAGVMAHEISHVTARHGTKQATKADMIQIGAMAAMIFVPYGWAGYAIYEGMNLAIPLTFLKFSRDAEREADFLGIQYMYKAGYDPNAFVQFFEKLQAREKKKPGTLAKAFSTHPPTPDRIAHSQDEISRILPARQQYVITTSEFDEVKSRLAGIENRRKVVDDKAANKPSLRRTAQTTDKSGTPDSSGDDRPTLHRRDDSN
jgi:beta-barrel assembly-enhancing protease